MISLNKIEKNLKDDLVKLLREEFEQKQEYDGKWEYQWVMGIGLRKLTSDEYLARVTVKTSESPYIDGMDIKVYVVDGQVKLEDAYYENSPDLMGSPQEDAVAWMEKLDQVIYLQLENPWAKEIHKERLEIAVGRYLFTDLGDYNSFDSHVRNIINLYKALLMETLALGIEDILVDGVEANPGQYKLEISIKDQEFKLDVNDKHTKVDIIEKVVDKIILPLVGDEKSRR